MNALMEHRRQHTTRTVLTALTLFALALLCGPMPASAAQLQSEMTLAEFRAAVRDRVAAKPPSSLKRGEKPAADIEPEKAADRAVQVFTRLLSAQARKAAARQSQDRLAGWRKAAEARLQAQNTTALDADQLRLAEAQASGRVAQFEAARLRALGDANQLLGRPAASPLVAAMAHLTAAVPADQSIGDQTKKNEQPAAAAAPSATPPEPAPDLASRLSYYEKQLLPMSTDLLAKMYQSYLFGGIPLSSLLWQEQELTRIETEYRLLHVQAEIEFAKAADSKSE
jgi:hypothetical protein